MNLDDKKLQMERRAVAPTFAELRSETDSDKAVLTGYAARWNSLSVVLDDGEGEFRERLLPGCFDRSLAEGPDVVALAHHDERYILGRHSAGTLKLASDEHGLRTLIYPNGSTHGRDAVEDVRSGNLLGMSFGFFCDEERIVEEEGGVIREVVAATLFEVSIVVWPAYEASSIKVRSGICRRAKQVVLPPTKLLDAIQKQAEKELIL